jgi:hypothetical protein
MRKMAEQAQKDQVDTVRSANRSVLISHLTGMVLGAIVTLSAIAGAVYCASINQPWVAGVLLSVSVMAVAKALIDSAKKPQAAAPQLGPPPPPQA